MDHSLPQQMVFENQISILVLISMKINTLFTQIIIIAIFVYVPKFRKKFFFE